MKALLQRVSSASVTVENGETRSIGRGLVVLLGVAAGDTEADAVSLAEKVLSLRLFPTKWAFEKTSTPKTILQEARADPKAGADFDLSLADIGGDVLIVSQFTLLADVRKGRRPDFNGASKPEAAVALYRAFIENVEKRLITPSSDPTPVVATGTFGASMRVALTNEGPVTLLVDTAQK